MDVEYRPNSGGPYQTFVIVGNTEKVVIHDNGGFQSRNQSTIELILGAIWTHASEIGSRAFRLAFYTGDDPEQSPRPDMTLLAYSVTPNCNDRIIPAPDFSFLSWPEIGVDSYDVLCTEMDAAGQKEPEINKAFWIGNPTTHPVRMEMIQTYANHPALELNGMQWLPNASQPGAVIPTSYVSLPDHCKYKVLLDIRGAGYSGRFKFLMWSHRPILYIANQYEQFYTKHLVPNFHYYDVADINSLGARAQQLLNSHAVYDLIARESFAFAKKHLTRENAYRVYADIIINHCLV